MSEKLDIVKQWIDKADHDLGTAQLICLYLPEYKDTIAFHCQQAVEKYLKGYLLFLDIQFKRLHSLNYLLSLVSQKEQVSFELFDKASQLEDFSVEIRYPDTIIELSGEDIQQAFSIAKNFRKYVLAKMNLDIVYVDIKKIQ
jgi:HEPN domain-containing protein